jgi:hypothetical protein
MRLPHNDKLNWLVIKLSKALTVQSVQNICKIFIFLAEQQQNNQVVDVKYAIKQLTSVIVRVFGIIPKAA